MKAVVGIVLVAALVAGSAVWFSRGEGAAPVAAVREPAHPLDCRADGLPDRLFPMDAGVALRQGPGEDHPVVPDPDAPAADAVAPAGTPAPPAAEGEAETAGLRLGLDHVLKPLCETTGWYRVVLTEEKGEPVLGVTGWVRKGTVFAIPLQDLEARLLWDIAGEDGLTDDEKLTVRRQALDVLRTRATCGEIVDGGRNQDGEGFFATCVSDTGTRAFVIRLDPAAVTLRAATQREPFPEELSRQLCERAIRAHVVGRRTGSFALLDYRTAVEPSGERLLEQTFRASEERGRTVVEKARCVISPGGILEITIPD